VAGGVPRKLNHSEGFDAGCVTVLTRTVGSHPGGRRAHPFQGRPRPLPLPEARMPAPRPTRRRRPLRPRPDRRAQTAPAALPQCMPRPPLRTQGHTAVPRPSARAAVAEGAGAYATVRKGGRRTASWRSGGDWSSGPRPAWRRRGVVGEPGGQCVVRGAPARHSPQT
jgi:hypothetical protein